MAGSTSNSVVSPEWELFDPTPDPIQLFIQYNKRFFWGKLDSVIVTWSPRMTSCAGICKYEGRGGLCTISLSAPLLKLRPRKDLVETLLHEMIHAYLFVTQNNRDRDGHGPEFQKHMHRINSAAHTNITIYHNFYDEVRHYKTHVWKCSGPCQHRKPYYGIVRRASNRAPGPNDLWWKEHQTSCGGKYHKISEPEEFTKKQQIKQGKKDAKLKKEKAESKSKITNYFPNSSNKTITQTHSDVSTSKTKERDRILPNGGTVLGSCRGDTNSLTHKSHSSTPLMRRIAGFGDIPVRVGVVGTEALHQSSSTKNNVPVSTAPPLTSDTGKCHTPRTESTTNHKKPTNAGVVGNIPARNGFIVSPFTLVLSDSDDDVPLLTKPVSESGGKKRGLSSSTILLPESSRSEILTLSDSDDEALDTLISRAKRKKRSSTTPFLSQTSIEDGSTSLNAASATTRPSTVLPSSPNIRISSYASSQSAASIPSTSSQSVASIPSASNQSTGSCPLCGVVLPLKELEYHAGMCCSGDDPDITLADQGVATGTVPTEVMEVKYVSCPVCDQIVSTFNINRHLDNMCASV